MLWLWYTSLSMEHLQQKMLIWSQPFLFQLHVVTDISAVTKLLHKTMHDEPIFPLPLPRINKSASSSYPPSLWPCHLWELTRWNNGLRIHLIFIISCSTVKLKQTLHQRTTGGEHGWKLKKIANIALTFYRCINYVIEGPGWREKAHSWIFTVWKYTYTVHVQSCKLDHTKTYFWGIPDTYKSMDLD